MAQFNVQLDDGRTLHIEADDADGARAVAENYLSSQGQPSAAASGSAPDAPVTAGGLAAAGGSGVVNGGIGMAGLLGAAGELGARGLDKATRFVDNKLGIDAPAPYQAKPVFGDQERLQNAAAPYLHTPQNTAEKYAANVGEFVPGLALGGGSGSLARRAIMDAVLPGITSEAAGQATEGTAAEPYARIGAALLTPSSAMGEAKRAAAAVPSSQELKDIGGKGFDAFRASGLQVNSNPFKQWALNTSAHLEQTGTDADLAPLVHKKLDRLANATGSVVDAQYLDSLQKQLGTLSTKTLEGKATDDAKAAKYVLRQLDKHLDNINPSDVVQGDLSSALQTWRTARANSGAGLRSDAVQQAAKEAAIDAAKANSGKNIGNVYKSKFAPFVKRTNSRGAFDAGENAAFNNLIFTPPHVNLMRNIGNRLGGGGGVSSTALGLMGAGAGEAAGEDHMTAGAQGLGLALLGSLARGRYNAAMANRVRAADTLVRSRAPASQALLALHRASNPSASPLLLSVLRAVQARQALGSTQ